MQTTKEAVGDPEKGTGYSDSDSDVTTSVATFQIEEEGAEREEWGSWFDFILSCIGYAVGLGNLWRFPYLCYENGGGAFLIPYIIMLICCGLPLFFMELSFGQFASQGALSVWNISPLFTGVGIGMMIVAGLVAIYYNVIIAWTIYYAYKSFTFPTLEWIACDNEWNTEYCYDDFLNTTRSMGRGEGQVRATEEFWTRKVHDLSETIGDIGGINWHLLGCLAASWLVVGLCISKGVKSSGKVVYFTAVFPYVVLVILFFRGVTLPGAGKGITFYIVPKFEDLLAIKPWRDAASQIFYSLGISFGSLITFASYNKFHNNCYRDALIVALTNCGTSIFAGFVIFSTLGFMAESSGQEVQDVVASGPGLAFIAYPEALARMPGSQFWSFLFFFMLFTLGLDSEFAMTETIITAIVDSLPPHKRKWKPLITLAICIIGFLAGIIMVTKSGLYIFTLMDWYSAGFSLMAIAATYCLVISWIYGVLVCFLEYARSCRRKGSIVERRFQSYLHPILHFGSPVLTSYYFRFILYLALCIPCAFQLPTLIGGISLLLAALIYFKAALGGESWSSINMHRRRRSTRTAHPPTHPPPRPAPRAANESVDLHGHDNHGVVA